MGPLLLVDIEATITALAKLVQTWNSWFCCPIVTFLQVQGAVVLLLLALGWCLAGAVRLKEVRRRLRLPDQPTSSQPSKKQGWPGVTVILPLKGCRKYSLRNWESQLTQEYEGRLEFLFVVDSADDPAVSAALAAVGRHPGVEARILVASPSTTNSQKIHNIQTAVQAACRENELVLCVDDDVSLHPSTVKETVEALLSTPAAFMATGYPFDIPNPDSNLLTYSVLSYHLPLLVAFSVQRRTHFVWGGFMMFRLRELLDDTHGIMQAWRSGGYSDDLIVAAKCSEHGLQILCPAFAVFPQRLDGECSWQRYWNYLRRQLYVMDTYRSPLNRRINHTMMLVHAYLSLAFVVPAATVCVRLVLCVLATILLPTQKVYVGPGTSMRWVGSFGAPASPWSTASLLAFMAAAVTAGLSLRWMTGVVLALFQCLSPRTEPIDIGVFHWGQLWLGFLLNNALIPPCMLYTRLTARVVWSGVEYERRCGRVVGVRCRRGGSSSAADPWKRPGKAIDAAVA